MPQKASYNQQLTKAPRVKSQSKLAAILESTRPKERRILEVEPLDFPPPVFKNGGDGPAPLYRPIFDEMKIGQGVKISRGVLDVRQAVQRYKRLPENKHKRFTVRSTGHPRVSYIWRIE